MSILQKRGLITASVVLAILLAASGVVFFAGNRKTPDAKTADAAAADDRDRAKVPVTAEPDSLEGEWHAVEVEVNGKKDTSEGAKDLCLVFRGDELIAKSLSGKGKERRQKFKLDRNSPEAIDVTDMAFPGGPEKIQSSAAIYSLKKDRLSFCSSMRDPAVRPSEFKTQDGDGRILIVLERAKAKQIAANPALASTGVKEFWSIMAAAQNADNEFWKAHQSATSKAAKEKATIAKAATIESLAARCLQIAQKRPQTEDELASLFWAASRTPETDAGRKARALLDGRVAGADFGQLGKSVVHAQVGSPKGLQGIAPAIFERVKNNLNHPDAARLLATVCSLSRSTGDENEAPASPFAEAADLIAERFADSADIDYFCGTLTGPGGSPPWATQYERHLRAICAANRNRATGCVAHFALASVVHISSEERQGDAAELYEKFCTEFDGTHPYSHQMIEQNYLHEARIQLHDLRFHAVGQIAPDIAGIDLDGRPLKLSDYRGRVALLNFWGTWCFPCMKLIPHEKELAEAYRGQPFDVVGINCDPDIEKARAAVTRTGMTWRSFRNEAGDKPAITKEWKTLGFPTVYLIDHHGIIRKRWVGAPTPDELGHMVRVLVEAAKQGVPADGMRPVVATFKTMPAAKTARATTDASPRTRGRFVDKVYRGHDGDESKFAVFVPPGYDGAKNVPAILFLHGSGPKGTDGRAHLQTGLAKVIRENIQDFPFLVVFPQARDGEDWLARGAGSRRALAILAQAQTDYRIDPDRIALTGLSMGGAGAWSLAAAEPDRWSAIVPICHGGDVTSAARLAKIPCWCFHGAADRIIPAKQSRDMIDAIAAAGGKPLYQEFPDAGHNDCPERAYAANDLHEWLLLQNRARR